MFYTNDKNMGVNRIDYLIIGYKLPYNVVKDWWEKPYEDYIDGLNDVHIITDGMCGDYAVFGKILAQSEHNDWEGWNFVEIKNEIDNDYSKVEKEFVKVFDGLLNFEDYIKPKIILFSHFS